MACTLHVCRTSLDVHILAGARETYSMHVTLFNAEGFWMCLGNNVHETHSLVRVELPPTDDSLVI